MLGQLRGVADGAAEHAGNRLFIRTDDAHDLQVKAIVVQVAQACLGIPQVGVGAGVFIPGVAAGRQHHPESQPADILIAPALVGDLNFLLIEGGIR